MSKTLENIVSAPAIALEKTVDNASYLHNSVTSRVPLHKAREYWKNLGPGLTTGASDDDPSGIATYSQTGAQYGFQFLWLAGFTFPFMAVVQEMCARIGLVTGRGLAASIRLYYPRWILYICTLMLFIANVLNLGADIGAMAKASQLLFPEVSFKTFVIGFAVFGLILQIFSTYEHYAKYLKWLALLLITYILTAYFVDVDWKQVLWASVIPSMEFNRDNVLLVTAILGTTISPYLFFWQTSQEVEEQILDGKTTLKLRQAETSPKEISDMRVDVWSGMFLSNLVMFFIILVTAATLNKSGITTIQTAADAANALRPLAGDAAYLMFALGIIGTGMLAVPVLAGSASYAISESFGWKYGLYRKLKEAYAFYGVIIIATLIGLGINFLNIDPIKALIYSAVLNGVIAAPILALIVMLSSNKKVMGQWANGPISKAFGWGVVLIMAVAGLSTLLALFY